MRSGPAPPNGHGDIGLARAGQRRRVGARLWVGMLAVAALALSLALAAGGTATAHDAARAHASDSTPAAVPADIKKITWGIDDQNIALFADKRWYALPLKSVRYFVPWDLRQEPHYLHRADRWLTIAGRSHTSVLIALTQSDIKGRTRYLPSLKQYGADVRWLMHRFPWTKAWTPWNEANLPDQATLHNPARAAGYWRVALKLCGRRCTVTSPSLVGYRDASESWMNAFLRAAHGLHGPWAIHVY